MTGARGSLPISNRERGKFNLGTDSLTAWEGAFLKWKGGSGVEVLATVVFHREWQRPVLMGVTVGYRTVVVQTTYGAHPCFANTLTINACNTLLAHSADCCAFCQCELDYTEPEPSLPEQPALSRIHIIAANGLGKPLVLQLHASAGHPTVFRLAG